MQSKHITAIGSPMVVSKINFNIAKFLNRTDFDNPKGDSEVWIVAVKDLKGLHYVDRNGVANMIDNCIKGIFGRAQLGCGSLHKKGCEVMVGKRMVERREELAPT